MKQLIVFFIIALLTASCGYYNNDYYDVDVTPGPLPEVTILSTFDSTFGEITILDSLLFSYLVEVDSGRVYFTYLEFQGYEGIISDTNAASVWIRVDTAQMATHYDLNMSVAYKTNSGNLADKIDVEYAIKDTSWNIRVKEEIEGPDK